MIHERQESRCSFIFDSCTFAWHTGQLTITTEVEEDEDEVAVLCCAEAEEDDEVICGAAADLSLDATDSLPILFWKKSKTLAELRSSLGLFLEAPAAPPLGESWKYLDCVASTGLLLVCTTAVYLGKAELLGKGFDVLEEGAPWLLACFGTKEEVEAGAFFGDVSSPVLVSVSLKRSLMDFCLTLSTPLLLLGLKTLTGEPLMLTNARVLPTDLFTGGFGPVEVAGLIEGKELEIPLLGLPWLAHTGEFWLLSGDGVKSLLGDETE